VARFWRDLEKKHFNLPILSISDQEYYGLSRHHPVVSFEDFFYFHASKENTFINSKGLYSDEEIFKKDKVKSINLNKELNKYPLSEPAIIKEFSKNIPAHSLLFLGNSLPIREWNLVADYNDKHLKYLANRGANGIDGILSTFLGAAEPKRENWCLIGDLSCLYDLSAPWIFQQIKKTQKNIKCFLLIINNRGGQIFSSLFSNPLFLNTHDLQFKNWAKMWNFNYYSITHWPNSKKHPFQSPAVIEWQIDPKLSSPINTS